MHKVFDGKMSLPCDFHVDFTIEEQIVSRLHYQPPKENVMFMIEFQAPSRELATCEKEYYYDVQT